ncbi:MAG: hypothetical protein IPG91_20065 [Ideonella sp.]|nr:hypothetical protein [Ideonella sp.]
MKFGIGALRALCIAAISALFVSCGGEELVPFSPARLLVFGDQASVIVAAANPGEGRKYTINAVDADTGVFVCDLNPIWVQVLAFEYGISFRECPFPAEFAQVGYIRAMAGATAGGSTDIDLTAQVTRQLALAADAGGGINSTDLVTVYIGVNDIVAAFERYKAGIISSDEAVAEAEAAGETLAQQINRIAEAGGKVIVSTVPDVSVTPYAVTLGLEDPAYVTMLRNLTERVNARLLVTINNDGRKIGLIEINPYVAAVIGNPLGYGYANVEDAACLEEVNDVPLPVLACTSNTLQPSATAATWLWADALQFGPQGHGQLGSLAASRARSQPF